MFTVHPDRGQILVVPHNNARYSIEIYDLKNGDYLDRLEGASTLPRQIVVSPNGSLVAILSKEKLDLWDLETKSIYYSSNEFKRDETLLISFSQDDSKLFLLDFSLETNMKITLDAKTGQIIGRDERPDYGHTVFSKDNSISASVTKERKIIVRNELTGEIIHELVGHYRMGSTYDSLYSLEFANDDRMLITIGNNLIRFWDVESGQLHGEISPDFSVRHLAISPDGQYMATTGTDGTIRLWAIVYTYEP